MSAHLLIVGYYTYPVHRERLITGSGSLVTPYQLLSVQSIQDICSDFSRVSKGDHIYFYVVQDSQLNIKVPVLKRVYHHLYGSDCSFSRKADIISAIRANLERIENPEEKILRFFTDQEEYEKDAYRYLLEVLGEPETSLESGFHGIYEVVAEPYIMEYGSLVETRKNVYGIEPYDRNTVNNYLWMRIKVKPTLILPNPISEFTYLDDFTDEVMSWTVLYRKLFGKRSCTSIPPIEEKKLIRLLENANRDYNDVNSYNDLAIDVVKEYAVGDHVFRFKPDWNNDLRGGSTKLSQFVASQIPESSQILQSEALLESAILYELANTSGYTFLDSVSKRLLLDMSGIPSEKIVWVGNQVICSAGGSRSDIVTFQTLTDEEDRVKTSSINAIELKNQLLEPVHLDQVGKYARWLATTYAQGTPIPVRNIVIGYGPRHQIDNEVLEVAREKSKDVSLLVFTYCLENGIISLHNHVL